MEHQHNATYWQVDNLPNRLTFFRLCLMPVVVIFLILCRYESPSQRHLFGLLTAILFIIASITDFFDGHIARKKKMVTIFGSFLDPIADKFLVVSSLIMLLSLQRISDWAVIVLVLREMYMMSLRQFAITEGINVPVNDIGKWKTVCQMTAIPMLMVYQKWWIFDWRLIGTLLIYLACFLSIISSLVYSFKLINKLQIVWKEKIQGRKKL